MNIALCLSGQPRGVEKAHEYVKRNLLDIPHQHVDVFCHVPLNDRCAEDERVLEIMMICAGDVFRLYRALSAQTGFILAKDYKDAYAPFNQYPAIAAASAFFSMYEANELKKQAEEQGNFKYDIVIRSRYDYALNIPLSFAKLDTVGDLPIVVPSEPHNNQTTHPKRDRCNDQFAFSSSAQMDKYCATFLHLDEFMKQGIPFIGEDLLAANLAKEGLVGQLLYQDMKPQFQADGYNNNTPHSLVRDDVEYWRRLYE